MASSAAPLPYGAFRVPEGFPPCFAKPASSGDAKKVAPTASGPIVPKFRMAIVPSKLWSVGQTLKVYLYPNTLTAEKNKWIKDTACEWTRFANLKFDFVDTLSADIRVSFEYGKGNHSAIGRDAHTLAAGGASMNLDPKYLDGKNPNYERFTVLHEFGHALGADHEQQSPSGGIKWNASALYKKYAQINWSKADVDRWIINPTLESTEATPLDALSVMMYVVGPEDTLDGWSTVTNPHLSNWDVQWILRHYPHTDIGINPYTKTASTNWNGGRDGAVYYQDNSACICEAKLTEGKWEVTNRIIGSAKWGSPLAAISWDEGKQIRVYAISDDNKVAEFSFVPSPLHWGYKVLRDLTPPPNTDGWFSTHPDSGLAAVCWYENNDKGSNINIRVYAQVPSPPEGGVVPYHGVSRSPSWASEWDRDPILFFAAPGTHLAAACYFLKGLRIRIYFQATDKQIHQYGWDPEGSWSHSSLFKTLPAQKSTWIHAHWHTNPGVVRVCWTSAEGSPGLHGLRWEYNDVTKAWSHPTSPGAWKTWAVKDLPALPMFTLASLIFGGPDETPEKLNSIGMALIEATKKKLYAVPK